jgi:transcription initiation factor TFIIH subunit 1
MVLVAGNRARGMVGMTGGKGKQREASLAPSPSPASRSGSLVPPSRATSVRPTNVNSYSNSSSTSSTVITQPDWQARASILKSNPDLAALHHSLVMTSRVLTEAEFWEGREDMLNSESFSLSQKTGRIPQMINTKQIVSGGGKDGEENVINISESMVRDIFEIYPVVKKVWDENVPKKVCILKFDKTQNITHHSLFASTNKSFV